jgi:hypothetical protein
MNLPDAPIARIRKRPDLGSGYSVRLSKMEQLQRRGVWYDYVMIGHFRRNARPERAALRSKMNSG